MIKLLKIGAILGVVFLCVQVLYVCLASQNPSPTVVKITRGDRLSTITNQLYESKTIRSKTVFTLWIYLTQNQNKLKAGIYEIPKNSTVRNIAKAISSGRFMNRLITIPEGMTSRQITDILNKTDLPGKVQIPREGSLLPQTYAYTSDMQKSELIVKMQSSMDDVIAAEWANRNQFFTQLATPEEAIILASIVEKETSVPEERPIVASVYLNRLRLKMRLQSDPTVVYDLTKGEGNMHGKKLFIKHLQTDSPHNTYTRSGLPPTAICNPGRDSIRAVLHPARTNYLYFVADGTGGHKFAKNLPEHEKNRSEWRKIRDK